VIARQDMFDDAVPADRDSLVTRYTYLRRRATRKFLRPGLERADLEQIAVIGLLKAYDRYDSRLRTPFEAFAWLFIVGELMHYVRDHERLVRPPRRLRALEKRVGQASDALVCELGREPTVVEIATRMRVDVKEVHAVTSYRDQAIPHSLDTMDLQHAGNMSYTLEQREDTLLLNAALERLTTTERTIVLALYACGYTQLELAERLGYSRRHISRLHRGALEKMRPIWIAGHQ
jgi:RNA polymerase sigma-B factor